MILPTFFVPGAAKSGTSALHDYLKQHPDIYMSPLKEPHFFSHDENFAQGIHSYARLFEKGASYHARGESSTGYMIFPKTIERIQQYIPDPKFIFVLRNPIDRAYSHYWWLRGRGFETRGFREAFLADLNDTPDPVAGKNRGHAIYRYYYQTGCYAKWLSRFIHEFGRDRVFVVINERLQKQPLTVVNECSAFLQVASLSQITHIRSNEALLLRVPMLYRAIADWKADFFREQAAQSGSVFLRMLLWSRGKMLGGLMRVLRTRHRYPELDSADRAWLRPYYEESVAQLRALVGQPLVEWEMDFPS